MSDIFLCYSRADAAVADRLVARLTEEWSVFIDRNMYVGRRWHREIERELHSAKAVVVLWSATSRDSDYVLDEADYGKRKDILFPAFIERVECPYGFGRLQTADLIGWDNGGDHVGLMQLLITLRVHLNGDASASPISAETTDTETIQTPALPAPGRAFRDKLKTGGEGPLMVTIPAGRFLMGSLPDEPGRYDDEIPQHEVSIAQPFALGVYPVTFDDYDLFCNQFGRERPRDENWGRGNRPVINVSWHDARDYCRWLSDQTGCNYRLPSEAEWEYACRAGTQTPYFFGSTLAEDKANFERSVGETTPVGAYPSNAFGLWDMHGNVWEWCEDTWHENYHGALVDGSAWLGGSNRRVLRGGSWDYDGRNCRSASRKDIVPSLRHDFFGFRLARGQ